MKRKGCGFQARGSSRFHGLRHFCGVATDGVGRCWGWNGFGQLGNGTNSVAQAPTTVLGGTWASLGSGASTTCGINDDNFAYCWGANGDGHVGDGTTTDRNVPTAVLLNVTSETSIAVAVDTSLTFIVSGHAGTCNGVSQSPASSSSGTAIGLGRINSANGVGAQDLAVSTNAASGFTIYGRSTGPLGVIDDISGSNAVPGAFPALGTEGFGYTTSDATLGNGTPDRFTNGGAKWAAMTTTDAEISAQSGIASADTVCVAFQAGVGPTTPAGMYSTNVIYTALARF